MSWKDVLIAILLLYLAYQHFRNGSVETAKTFVHGSRYVLKTNVIEKKACGISFYPYQLGGN